MSKHKLTDPSQVPLGMTDSEEAEFWSTHETTKEYLDKIERTSDTNSPPRSTSITVRFDEDTLQRLKKLASRRGKRYQTLLKEFIIERLYEEEQKQKATYEPHTLLPRGVYMLQSGFTGEAVDATRPEFASVYNAFCSYRWSMDTKSAGGISSRGEESSGALGDANAGIVAAPVGNIAAENERLRSELALVRHLRVCQRCPYVPDYYPTMCFEGEKLLEARNKSKGEALAREPGEERNA